MFYYLYEIFYSKISFFRVFKYISIRAGLAFFISFLIVLILGKPFINYLRRKKLGDSIREEGPSSHFTKKGTPTMGGVLIISSLIGTSLLTCDLKNKFVIILMISTILLALVGFLDDYMKFSNKKGLSGKKKIIAQLFVSFIIWAFIYKLPLVEGSVNFSIVNPIIKNSYLYIGAILYFIFIAFVITGSSNAVNITDGLDGLVIGPVIIVSFIFAIIAYLTGHSVYSTYLNLYSISGAGEILVYLCAVMGAGLGFLWYNFYPAQIFMGDTGSLSLGGMLGIVAILLKQELLLPIIGFIFVLEASSVMIQVWYFKKYKKRIFKMAPIHHHFELSGLPETKVTLRFWTISILCGIIGIIILKLR